MSKPPTSVFVEHVRCFSEAQSIPVRRLTLLVGANNSGKSTFLAVASYVFDRKRFRMRPLFNCPPYDLGPFDAIVTFKNGKHRQFEEFSLGFEAGEPECRKVKAAFLNDRGTPTLGSYRADSQRGSIKLTIDQQSLNGEFRLGETTYKMAASRATRDEVVQEGLPFIPLFLSELTEKEWTSIFSASKDNHSKARFFDAFIKLSRSVKSPYDVVFSLAPMRTKPRRTYDELAEEYSPEGDHIPAVLARTLSEGDDSDTALKVREAVELFGQESGLFESIEIRKLGKGVGDPFQIRVLVDGMRVNLADVGYGVSQALPLVVQSAMHRGANLFLIQQPEVHLHPKAQAALGSFFARQVVRGKNSFMIETHSDFLVDRVRQEIASGNLKPDQVQLLFFSKDKLKTRVFPIEIDHQGNIVDPPEHYREFFLEEELRLLG